MAFGEMHQRIQLALPKPSKLFTPGVIVILALMIVGYALVGYFPEWVAGNLALFPQNVIHGRVWQLVTYSFMEACPWNLVWHIFAVLLCASAIERDWRTRSFLLLWLVVGVTCGVMWTAISLIVGRGYLGMGAQSCVYGVIGAFGLLFRRQRLLVFFWGMEAQYLCLLLIGIGLVIGIRQPITWIWVSGAGVGYLYVKLRLRARWAGSATAQRAAVGRFDGID